MVNFAGLYRNSANRFSTGWRCLRRCEVPGNIGEWVLYCIARGHPFDGWRTKLARFMGDHVPKLSLKGRWGGDWTLALNPGDISHMVIFEELVIDRTWNLDMVPFEPDTIIDAGSHIGLFASLAGSRFRSAKLICIEPDKENLKWLKHNLALNHIEAQVIEGVVLDHDGEASFQPGLSYGGKVIDKGQSSDSISQVRCVSLDRILVEAKPKRLLLKMDIEGAEDIVLPYVLKTLLAPCFLFLETHGGEPAFERLSTLCREAGFQVTLTRSHGQMRECFAVLANCCAS